nr:hypothetical protein [Kineococcus vitellinus]
MGDRGAGGGAPPPAAEAQGPPPRRGQGGQVAVGSQQDAPALEHEEAVPGVRGGHRVGAHDVDAHDIAPLAPVGGGAGQDLLPAPLGGAQPGGAQAHQQLAGADPLGAGGDGALDEVGGDVVVVTLEGAPGQAEGGGEGVQLLGGGVAGQVRPPPPVRGVARGVDEDAHARAAAVSPGAVAGRWGGAAVDTGGSSRSLGLAADPGGPVRPTGTAGSRGEERIP